MPESWQADIDRAARRLAPVGRAHGVVPDLHGWCAQIAGPDAVVVERDTSEFELPPGGVASLPGTLEVIENPRLLLERLASELDASGTLVAAVTWGVPSTADARRAFHPASFVGLLTSAFAVVELVATDSMLGVRAKVESLMRVRKESGLVALAAVQPEVEDRLDQRFRQAGTLRAWQAAASGLQQTVISSDQAHFATRRQRNEARQKVKDVRASMADVRADRDVQARRAQDLTERLAQKDEELRQARQRANGYASRLQRLESGRWWRFGMLLREVKAHPSRIWALPVRLLRLARSNS